MSDILFAYFKSSFAYNLVVLLFCLLATCIIPWFQIWTALIMNLFCQYFQRLDS